MKALKTSEEFDVLVMLDTNVMNYVYLYIHICDQIGVDQEQENYDLVKIKLKKRLKKSEQEKAILFNELEKGYHVYKALKLSSQLDPDINNCSFYFSKLAELELNHICLESKYHMDMAECNIPYRIRNQNPFKIELPPKYLADLYTTGVHEYVQNIKSILDSKGIEIIILEEAEPSAMVDTINIISTIFNKYLHLQSNDLYLYCLSVYQKIDYIYSFDNEFKKLGNNLMSGSYKSYQSKIAEEMCKFRQFETKFEFDKNGNHNVVFPEVITKLKID